jgi:hypothetical protein
MEFCHFKMIGKTFWEDRESADNLVEQGDSSYHSDSDDSDILGEGFEFDVMRC